MRPPVKQLELRPQRTTLSRLFVVCVKLVFLCVVGLSLSALPAIAGELAQDSSHAVHRTPFVSPGRFVWDQIVAPIASGGEALVVSRPLDLPRRARVTRTHRPLRQFTFVDGDRVSGELLPSANDSLRIRSAGGHVASVSRSSLEAIAVPPGEVETITQSSLTPSSPESRATVAISHEASRGTRIQFWFRVERAASASHGGKLSFDFSPLDATNNATERLSLQLDGTRLAVVERPLASARWTTQSVELTPGWHSLTTVSTSAQFVCLVDETLLASCSDGQRLLRAIRFAPRADVATSESDEKRLDWISDLLVSSRHDTTLHDERPVLSGRSFDENDVVSTHSGDEYFGRIELLDESGIRLNGIAGEGAWSWSRLAGLAFRSAERPMSSPLSPTSGIVARLDWQPFVDRPQLPTDRLTVTILAVDHETLLVTHPWLGEFLVPWRSLQRITPLFVGRSQVIDARSVHLGDSIRAEFRRPRPDGTSWRGEFELTLDAHDRAEDRNVWLSLAAADLEPSHPDTPPRSPFLKELRAGRLITEVVLNGQAVGDLNRLVRFKASPNKPDHLRYPLPRESLRPGTNTLELRLRPLIENGSSFDDWELSNVRLEVRGP